MSRSAPSADRLTSDTTAAIGAGYRGFLTAQRATLLVAALGTFMALMDAQVVTVAFPTISREFHSSTSTAQWLITAYALTLAAAMPTSGWAGDRFGTKRVMLCAVTLFTGASALCAIAPSLGFLIGVRVLQGVGGGMVVPIGLAMMYRAYPMSDRIGATKTLTMITMLAPATAPLIGGLIVTEGSWRWIFLINIPFGCLALLLTSRYVTEYRRESGVGFDLPGLLLGGLGIAAVLYGISDGPISGWGSARVVSTLVLGVLMLVAFVLVETRRKEPMLDLRLLAHDQLFRVCCGVQALQPVVFGGALVYTSLYIQEARGMSALASGTSTFPEAVAIWFASRLVARIYKDVGPRRLIAAGFLILMAGAIGLSQLGADGSLWFVRACTFTLGIGTAFVAMSVRTAAYANIDSESTGHAAAMVSSAQRIGIATGVALLSSVLAISAGTSLSPAPTDFRPVFLTSAGVGLLGFLLAWRIRDADAASTMER